LQHEYGIFGGPATIGRDAGVNLFHEFEPGVRQIALGHAPKFVFGIEDRIKNGQNPREVVSSSAK
jgi:hypothetical protein